MTAQYKTLNVKLPNSQLNESKYAIKMWTKVTLNLSSNFVGDSTDENNFAHKLLLTNTQVSKIRKAFVNNSLTDINLSKIQLYKITQSGGFGRRFLGPLLKTRLPLMGNLLKTLAKSVLIPLGIMVVASATDVDIHKKIFRSGFTTLLISNEEMNDIIKKLCILKNQDY